MTHRWSADAGRVELGTMPKAELHSMPIAPDKVERAAMAKFCESLTPEDWLALEQLSERVRNALLKRTIAVALKWRSRRPPKKKGI